MKFGPEKMPQIPEISPEVRYLEQGIKVQKLLNEALHKARLRKKFIEQGMPEQITRNEVEEMKENYDGAARELASLQEKLSLEQKEKYSKLDTLEDFQKAFMEEMSKTQEFTPVPKTQPDRDFSIPEEGMTEPDRDFSIPEEGMTEPDKDFMTDLTEEKEK